MKSSYSIFKLKNSVFTLLIFFIFLTLISWTFKGIEKELIHQKNQNWKSFPNNSFINYSPISKTKTTFLNKENKLPYKEILGKGYSKIVVNKDIVTTKPILVNYNFLGEIGSKNLKDEDHNPTDNIFNVNLDRIDKQKQYVLRYEVDGLSDVSSVTRSINNSFSLGGYLKSKSDGWNIIKEVVDPKLLKVGNNQVLFNALGNGDYFKIKNLKIEEQSDDNSSYEIVTKVFNDKVIYIRGFVKESANIKSIEIQNKKIELIGNEFEYLNQSQGKSDEIVIHFNSDLGKIIDEKIVKTKGINDYDLKNYVEAKLHLITEDSFGKLLGLRNIDIPPLESSIVNISANNSGFRYQLSKNGGNVKIPYDLEKIPKGYSEKDINTFSFDYSNKKWQRAVVDSVNIKKKYIVLKATLGKGNTDYINGVIKQPESPETASFTPTTVNDVPIANPASKINLISPPSANQQGSANVQYPLEIPAGINGFQPNVSINYNSDSKSGWAGVGWDVPVETIEIDTRWGVPEFDPLNESEIYTISGEQLVFDDNFLPNKDPIARARTNDRQFYFRNGITNGLTITRKGTSTSTYFWEILDGSGTKKVYSQTLKDLSGNVVKWFLESITDKYGNVVTYNYDDYSANGKNKYLRKILYSNNTSIEFISKDKTDITSSYRLGVKISELKLLDKITVSRATKKVREYVLNYKTGDFGKTLLSEIIQKDGNGLEFNKHKLNYTLSDNNFDIFNDNKKVVLTTSPDYLNSGIFDGSNFSLLSGQQSKSDGYRGALTIGFSKSVLSWFLPISVEFNKNGTFGINGSYTESETFGKTSLMDIDGDGLPDKVFYKGDGFISYRKNLSNSFSSGSPITINSLGLNNPLSRNNSYVSSFGFEASFKKRIGASVTFSKTKGNSPTYFSDVNGDSLPDYVNYGEVFFSRIVNGVPTYVSTDTSVTPNAIKDGVPAVITTTPEETYTSFSNIVRVWEAPVSGEINIANSLLLEQNSTDGVEVWIEKGSKSRADEENTTISEKIPETVTLNNQGQTASLNRSTHVDKGQRIYIIASNKQKLVGDKVKINTQIDYTSVTNSPNLNLNTKDANDNYYFKANYSDSYLSSSNKGNVIGDKANLAINWNTLNDMTLTDDVDFKIYKIEKRAQDTAAINTSIPTLIFHKKLLKGESLSNVANSDNSVTGINLNDLNVNQSGTETDPYFTSLYFDVSANTNVAWEKIKWNPSISIKTVSGTTTVNGVVQYNAYTERLSNELPNFLMYSSEGGDGCGPFLFSENYPVSRITFPDYNHTGHFDAPVILNLPELQNATVTFSLKSEGDYPARLVGEHFLKKTVKVINNVMEIPKIDLTGIPLIHYNFYVEIHSDNYEVAKYLKDLNANIIQIEKGKNYDGNTVECTNSYINKPDYYSYRSEHKNYNGQMGNMYQGWGGFVYNASKYSGQTLKENEFFKEVPEGDPTTPCPDPSAPDYEQCMLNFVNSEQNNRYFTSLQYNAENNSYQSPLESAFIDQNYLQPFGLSAHQPSNTSIIDPKVTIANPRGIIMHSSGWSLNLNGSFAGAGANGGYSHDKTWENFIDINGDQYPDIVYENSYQITDRFGRLKTSVPSLFNNTINSNTTNVGFGFSHGVTSEKFSNSSNTDFNSFGELVNHMGTSTSAAGFSANVGIGRSWASNNQIWLDVNGDSLLDFISNSNVYINNGKSFVLENWNVGTVYESESNVISGGGGVNLWGGSWVMGVGLNKSTSLTKTVFLDVNGDGLVDKLERHGVNYFAYFNTGSSFSQTPYNLGEIDYEIQNNQNTSGYNLFGTICLTIFKIKMCVSAGYNRDKTTTKQTVDLRDFNGDGLPDLLFSDDSSSLTAYYNKSGQYNLLTSIINPLKGEINIEYGSVNPISNKPIGSTYQMPFSKIAMTGVDINDKNKIPDNSINHDGPGFHYSIKKINFEYENGVQDRREREFLGFGIVKSHMMNEDKVHQTQVTEYETNFTDAQKSNFYVPYNDPKVRQYFYKKGIVKSNYVLDSLGRKRSETKNTYRYFDQMPASGIQLSETPTEPVYKDIGRIIPLLYKTENTITEYDETVSHSKTTVSTIDEYNQYGNVTKYTDRGKTLADVSDDIAVNISYHPVSAKNIVGIPSEHTVSINNTVVRKTTTVLDANDNIKTINKFLGNKTATYDLEYDNYGNLTKTSLPVEENGDVAGQRMFYKYEFDTTYHTYITKITDNYGFSSTTQYDTNYLLGVPTKITDLNGVSSYYGYDTFGRLTQYRSPLDTDWTIKLYYYPSEANPVAITERKATPIGINQTAPTNNYFSSIFTDGMGQEMAAKKLFKKDNDTYYFANNSYQLKDSLGRVIKSILRDKVTSDTDVMANLKTLEEYTLTEDQGILNYINYKYDEMDRPVQVIQNNVKTATGLQNLSTKTKYGFSTDRDGIVQFSKKITSPLGNVSISYTNEKGQTTATKQIGDGIEQWVSYKYDLLDQLLEVKNQKGSKSIYAYDQLGRKISALNPDAGLSTFEYDINNRIIHSQNELLKAANKKIDYFYHFNQLVKVQYPDHEVKYEFGVAGAQNYAAGRLIKQTDRTGTQTFKYSLLGQVTENVRIIVAPNNDPKLFKTSFDYDKYNRINKIIYPDREEINYYYDNVGLLTSIYSKPPAETDLVAIVSSITYNHRDQMTEVTAGNGTKTQYKYDPWSRLEELALQGTTTELRRNKYKFDANGNIKSIQGIVPMDGIATTNELSVATQKDFVYDTFNRLKSSTISATGGRMQKYYQLDMQYNEMNGITNKNSKLKTYNFGGCEKPANEGENSTYLYENSVHPNAVSEIFFNKGEPFNTPLDCATATPTQQIQTGIKERYSYDANGNQTKIEEIIGNKFPIKKLKRQLYWDEQNRIKGIVENGALQHYVYDASGERTLKSEGVSKKLVVDGDPLANTTQMGPYIYYPSGYLVLSDKQLSKHYYIGSQKIATRVSDIPSHGFAISDSSPYSGLASQIKTEAETLAVSGGLPTIKWEKSEQSAVLEEIALDEESCTTEIFNQLDAFNEQENQLCYKKLLLGYEKAVNSGFRNAVCNFWATFQQDDCMTDFPPEEIKSSMYWLHPDHLGSSSVLTDESGEISNWYEYLPFGEILMEQSNNSYDNPYKYNGKELDAATGLYYYGARYFDPRTSVWLSVDPLAEKYPSLSPYVYAGNNPVKYVDYDGRYFGPPDDHFDQNGEFLYTDNRKTNNIVINHVFSGLTHEQRVAEAKMQQPWLETKLSRFKASSKSSYSTIANIANHYAADAGVDLNKLEGNSTSLGISNYRFESMQRIGNFDSYNGGEYRQDALMTGDIKNNTISIMVDNGYVSNLLDNKFNMISALSHEGGKVSHLTLPAEPQLEGIKNHITIYKNQIKSPVFKKTTSVFQQIMKENLDKNIRKYELYNRK